MMLYVRYCWIELAQSTMGWHLRLQGMGTGLCGRQLSRFHFAVCRCLQSLLAQADSDPTTGRATNAPDWAWQPPGPLSRGKFSQRDCDAALRAVDSDLAKREQVNFAETGSDHHFVVF